MKVGDSLTLGTELSEQSDEAVKWTTSKKTVASVSKTGKITAKSAGEAVITAKVDNSSVKVKIKVTK